MPTGNGNGAHELVGAAQLRGPQRLAVAQERQVLVLETDQVGEDDGARDDRPGDGAAPDLVDARNAREALPQEAALLFLGGDRVSVRGPASDGSRCSGRAVLLNDGRQRRCRRALYETAAEYVVAVVEDGGLTGGNGALRLVEP